MKNLTAEFGTSSARVHGELIAVVAAIVAPDGDQIVAVNDEIFAACRESLFRVRGNRGHAVPMTWDDLRLMWAGTLRVCLNRLERKE